MSKAKIMKLVVIVLIVGATYAYQRYGGGAIQSPSPSGTVESSPPPVTAPPTARETQQTAPPPPVAKSPPAKTGRETARRKTAPPKRNDDEVIAQAFRQKRSDVMVESEGRVSRTLPDDNEGSRHQRFIVRLSNGLTVLIAHNIDLAPRVPLDEGDTIRFHGEYEWSERGGVVHWTHHDPRGRHEGGWLELAGKRYE